MRKTKNYELIKKCIDTSEMLYYYSIQAQSLLHQLETTRLTRTEKELYPNLLEELESVTY